MHVNHNQYPTDAAKIAYAESRLTIGKRASILMMSYWKDSICTISMFTKYWQILCTTPWPSPSSLDLSSPSLWIQQPTSTHWQHYSHHWNHPSPWKPCQEAVPLCHWLKPVPHRFGSSLITLSRYQCQFWIQHSHHVLALLSHPLLSHLSYYIWRYLRRRGVPVL